MEKKDIKIRTLWHIDSLISHKLTKSSLLQKIDEKKGKTNTLKTIFVSIRFASRDIYVINFTFHSCILVRLILYLSICNLVLDANLWTIFLF